MSDRGHWRVDVAALEAEAQVARIAAALSRRRDRQTVETPAPVCDAGVTVM
jgi:hypothetical protein